MTRIAVLRFSGPVAWDIDADEIWKLKNRAGAPNQGDLASVADLSRKSLTVALASRLGAAVVPAAELEQFQSQTPPSVNQAEQLAALAKHLGVRYVVAGQIDRLEFDGNTVTPDDYILIVSPRLIDTATGHAVWSQDLRKFKSEVYTKSSGNNVLGVFSSRQIPAMTEALANDVAGALGR